MNCIRAKTFAYALGFGIVLTVLSYLGSAPGAPSAIRHIFWVWSRPGSLAIGMLLWLQVPLGIFESFAIQAGILFLQWSAVALIVVWCVDRARNRRAKGTVSSAPHSRIDT